MVQDEENCTGGLGPDWETAGRIECRLWCPWAELGTGEGVADDISAVFRLLFWRQITVVSDVLSRWVFICDCLVHEILSQRLAVGPLVTEL